MYNRLINNTTNKPKFVIFIGWWYYTSNIFNKIINNSSRILEIINLAVSCIINTKFYKLITNSSYKQVVPVNREKLQVLT